MSAELLSAGWLPVGDNWKSPHSGKLHSTLVALMILRDPDPQGKPIATHFPAEAMGGNGRGKGHARKESWEKAKETRKGDRHKSRK